MESQVTIRTLLDRIRKDGIEQARLEADLILERARAEADALIAEAERRRERVVEETTASVEAHRRTFEHAMSAAARTLILGLRTEMTRLCRTVVERNVTAALTPEFMNEMLAGIIARWPEHAEDGIEVLVGEADRARLEDAVMSSLREELRTGVEIFPVEGIEAGFRIGARGGRMHYDFSSEAITSLLDEFLSPRIARFLRNDPGEEPGHEPHET